MDFQIDSEGRRLSFEVREDEEQHAKYDQILELLLAAGYFRARIKTLSPFDKVVGGMCWCITSCNFEVNVDLLFQENSTVGQQISLTEKIVAVLLRMKCPHRIEPHQIQGMDFIHIFPVMQWLVKRAIEVRAEMGDSIRDYGIYLFNKENKSQSSELSQKDAASDPVDKVQAIYGPSRQYRRKGSPPADERLRVNSTLLEYGRHFLPIRSADKQTQPSAEKQKIEESLGGGTAATDNDVEKAQREISRLMEDMHSDTADRIAASAVGNILSLHSSTIQQFAADYADKQATITNELAVNSDQHRERVIANLKGQIDHDNEKLSELEHQREQLKEEYLSLKSTSDQLQTEKDTTLKKIAEFDEIEAAEDPAIVNQLKQLLVTCDGLSQQEKTFKEDCVEALQQLEDELDRLRASEVGSVTSEETKARLEAMDGQINDNRDRIAQARLKLAAKNREIATQQRVLDDIPSRAELNQYQRRFTELYSQVASMHKQTKQFFTLYNTLDDKRLYLDKEANLLNSIYDGWAQVQSKSASAQQFLAQFEAIVESIQKNKEKLEKRRQSEKQRRDELNNQYLALVDLDRRYAKLVRDFQEECKKNELFAQKLAEAGLSV